MQKAKQWTATGLHSAVAEVEYRQPPTTLNFARVCPSVPRFRKECMPSILPQSRDDDKGCVSIGCGPELG